MTPAPISNLTIRAEIAGDEPAIHALTAAAFKPMAYSDGTEPAIIDALRAAGELTLSLVAVHGEDIVGQITFSPVTIDGVHDDWFGLGPVSVLPARQSEGIGGALIREGLSQLTAKGAKGCVLVGNPDYYGRFGFVGGTDLTYGSLDRDYVQRLALNGPARGGELLYAPSFEAAAASGDG